MEKPVRRAPIEGAVLDVLAYDPGALLVAATEEPTAIVQMRRRTAPGPMFILMTVLMCQFASLQLGGANTASGYNRTLCR